MRYHLTMKSRNAKTGGIPVSTTSADTCPACCPFNTANKGGCYADAGPLRINWKAVTEGRRGTDLEGFCAAIAALPEGTLWRHNQAGDLPGEGDTLDIEALFSLTDANRGRRGFTYTHKPLRSGYERAAVRAANIDGFTVNLSANNLQHADELADLNVGPVVAVLPSNQNTNTRTPAGRKVVVCPATQRDDVTCASC